MPLDGTPVGADDRADVDECVVDGRPGIGDREDVLERNVLQRCRRIARAHVERGCEHVAVRDGRDRDCIGCCPGRADRAETPVVPVVAGCDHGHDAGIRDVADGLDQRVADRIDLGPAAREVDHIHAVVHGRFERGDDLRCEGVVARRRRRVEDAVVPEPGSRRHTTQPGDRRMVRARWSRRARIACGDPCDVRPVEGCLSVEWQLPLGAGARARERARNDHLRRRELRLAPGEPGRIAETRRAEERVRLVDAVVDDADLDPVAAVTGRRPHLVGADDRRALVGIERVADARIDPGHRVEPRQRRQFARRQRDREAVENDPVAIRDAGRGDRTLELGRGSALCAGEARQIHARARVVDVQPRGPGRAEEVPVVGGERRQAQIDEHRQAPVGVDSGDLERPSAHARQAELAVTAADRLEVRGGGRRENQRRSEQKKNGAAQVSQRSQETVNSPAMADFTGKRGLVLGVANKRSIAWAIAKRLSDGGAQLAFTYQGERIEAGVRELAGSVDAPHVTACDVRSDEDVERVVAEAGEVFGGKLDLLVHSVAYAAAEDLEGRFTDTPRERFWMALDVSAYSLVAAARAAEPLMEAAGGGSILTMTYLGGERAVPHYNVMGVAKAALDSSVQYLAWDLGAKNIRVNAVSAGPVRTLAARSIAGFPTMEAIVEERAPLRRHISADDVGAAAAYLLSDDARNVTGTTLYVDSGYHAMGM